MKVGSLEKAEANISEGDASDGRIPLLILGGFLGAGKTTVLNHILREAKGLKIAALVNDVGEVNIDAAFTKDVAQLDEKSAGEIVELSNGCICCGIQSAFGEAVIELAKRKPDCIIVEATGIAEPQGIISSLASRDEVDVSALDYVRIVNLITLVDAQWWVDKVQEAFTPVRRSLLLFSDPRRPLSELLTLQVEGANVIVLNKSDLVDEESLQRSHSVLATMCPEAAIFTTSEGQVDIRQLLEVERFELENALKQSRCDQELRHDRDSDHNPLKKEPAKGHKHGDYGLMAFTFRARYPLQHHKFVAYLRSGVPGLLRAKGFAWTNRDLDRVGYLSLAGDTLRFDYLGKWMQARLEAGEIDRSQIPAEIWRNWDMETGDRRQEIVLIGIDLDRAAIESSLKNCAVM
ncbi:CobW family GTP-binding protein [Pelagicoccus albus]|uniref:GTP-binding protein n=1 Tax=Pelagicoccus albus TaxID=415222 RepID=A0A7X1B8X7_9BACT|nr:GTP-binding protein [Pelagicoccus albus]MBC2607838.1 GTP-binding protein [Pelagicoccus albus]